jgi:hypothetical protein
VRVSGPLKDWTSISTPRKRREYPFGEELRAKCDDFYFDNYVRWYGMAPFSTANGQIAQLNIWDDHDIIDGFGSYTDHFMRAPVCFAVLAVWLTSTTCFSSIICHRQSARLPQMRRRLPEGTPRPLVQTQHN